MMERGHFEDIGVDRKIILMWILKKRTECFGLNLSASG
jgi:hypothetical protein